MNTVRGKTIFLQNGLSIQKYDNKLVFLQRMGSFFPCWSEGKKTFLSQSVKSTFAKKFVHVLLVI
jgi:hypothetical protein